MRVEVTEHQLSEAAFGADEGVTASQQTLWRNAVSLAAGAIVTVEAVVDLENSGHAAAQVFGAAQDDARGTVRHGGVLDLANTRDRIGREAGDTGLDVTGDGHAGLRQCNTRKRGDNGQRE